jgi:NAD+ synthase (glutamine-hydrolysing)
MRIAAAVPEVAVGNIEKNRSRIASMMAEAAQKGAALVAFPELSLTSYTLGDLFRQRSVREQGEAELAKLLNETKALPVTAVIGMPVYFGDKLYNAAAVLQSGKLLGVVPKAYIPNYQEYYEQRWFASGIGVAGQTIELAGQSAPFGTDILFACAETPEFIVSVELCEDLWVPFPPHAFAAMAGAMVCVNISASNELAGKSDYRREMIVQQSGRYVCGYAYVSAGPGESTTDAVFGGHVVLAENGYLLESSPRFDFHAHMELTEFDLHRLSHDRILRNTFESQLPPKEYRRVAFHAQQTEPRFRKISRMPFVPEDGAERAARCEEVFSIQVTALQRRLRHTGAKCMVIGVSGGLDSALALMVAAEAAKRNEQSGGAVVGVVMPGFGSTEATQSLARRLVVAAGAQLREISIVGASKAHLADIGHSGQADITYENAQARERTQVLMDLANQLGALWWARATSLSCRWAFAPTQATRSPCTASTRASPRRSSARSCCTFPKRMKPCTKLRRRSSRFPRRRSCCRRGKAANGRIRKSRSAPTT